MIYKITTVESVRNWLNTMIAKQEEELEWCFNFKVNTILDLEISLGSYSTAKKELYFCEKVLDLLNRAEQDGKAVADVEALPASKTSCVGFIMLPDGKCKCFWSRSFDDESSRKTLYENYRTYKYLSWTFDRLDKQFNEAYKAKDYPTYYETAYILTYQTKLEQVLKAAEEKGEADADVYFEGEVIVHLHAERVKPGEYEVIYEPFVTAQFEEQ